MKKTSTLALLAVLSVAATSCQKETLAEPRTPVVEENANAACIMVYSIDGVAGRTTLRSLSEQAAFISRMVALAGEGHKVTFRQEDNTTNALAPKDVQTFSSTNKSEVDAWALEMFLLGYSVSIDYNKETGMYTGTATKDPTNNE